MDSEQLIPQYFQYRTVIVANGDFPSHQIPLSFLKNAERIVACDGAVNQLLERGIVPQFVVGDCDSIDKVLPPSIKLVFYSEQETNDLSKAFRFCVENGWDQITILGATGKREDHALGNFALLADFAEQASVQALTDYASFIPVTKSSCFHSYLNQQVSIFSMRPGTLISCENLMYPLDSKSLDRLWMGTLNQAISSDFTVNFDSGVLIIVRNYLKSSYTKC